jgi:phosphoglycolate phosphatase
VFFDLDGTLTDPKIGITRSIQYALEKLGVDGDRSKTGDNGR